MPDLTQFIELGATVIVVGLFLLFMLRKDRQSVAKDEKFADIVSNHINHNTEVLTEIKDTNRELLTWLKGQNGNK